MLLTTICLTSCRPTDNKNDIQSCIDAAARLYQQRNEDTVAIAELLTKVLARRHVRIPRCNQEQICSAGVGCYKSVVLAFNTFQCCFLHDSPGVGEIQYPKGEIARGSWTVLSTGAFHVRSSNKKTQGVFMPHLHSTPKHSSPPGLATLAVALQEAAQALLALSPVREPAARPADKMTQKSVLSTFPRQRYTGKEISCSNTRRGFSKAAGRGSYSADRTGQGYAKRSQGRTCERLCHLKPG